MEVSLLSFTQDADRLLAFSRQTRLKMEPSGYLEMSQEKIDQELQLVFGTIGSSWEFVDYVFLITNVSRAFTHQFVRHRIASFAQQTQRAVDLSEGFDYVTSGKCETDPIVSRVYDSAMKEIADGYAAMVRFGADIQDARGILPTNICTNIMAKFNLRSLSGMMNDRLCFRTQQEARSVVSEMRQRVLEVHPWAERVLQVNCVQYGFCKFTNFKECPMKQKGLVADPDTEKLKQEWEKIDFVVQPKSG